MLQLAQETNETLKRKFETINQLLVTIADQDEERDREELARMVEIEERNQSVAIELLLKEGILDEVTLAIAKTAVSNDSPRFITVNVSEAWKETFEPLGWTLKALLFVARVLHHRLNLKECMLVNDCYFKISW